MEEGNLESHGQPLADGDVQQVDFPLEPTKVTQSCRKLDFSPVRPMSDFPENCQIINLCSLSHRFCVQLFGNQHTVKWKCLEAEPMGGRGLRDFRGPRSMNSCSQDRIPLNGSCGWVDDSTVQDWKPSP